MIDRNFKLTRIGRENECVLVIRDPELETLLVKYGGDVRVKVSRPEDPGTDRQNRAMHPLLKAYYVTGMHSAPEGTTLSQFKDYMKYQFGVHYDRKVCGQHIVILKSWKDYTKTERRIFLDGMIAEIHESGAYAESSEIREIIAGMEGNT